MTLRLNGSSSGYVELDVPAAAGSHTLTLPDGGGSSGQYLQTNGSGALSWATVSTGLLQTQQTVVTTQTSFSTAPSGLGQWFDVPSMSINVTTTAANSKIILNAFVFGEHTDNEAEKAFKIVRTVGATSTNLSATGSSARPGVWAMMTTGWNSADNTNTPSSTPLNSYIDEPNQASGTTITYKVQVWSHNAGSTFYLNRTVNNTDHPYSELGWSYINLMEVAV